MACENAGNAAGQAPLQYQPTPPGAERTRADRSPRLAARRRGEKHVRVNLRAVAPADERRDALIDLRA